LGRFHSLNCITLSIQESFFLALDGRPSQASGYFLAQDFHNLPFIAIPCAGSGH